VSAPEVAASKGERLALAKEWARERAHGLSRPVVLGLMRLGVNADHLTMLGCVASVAAGAAFATGRFRLASILMMLSGVCDLLDGELARKGGRVSRFGAFLDSTLDRLGEGSILAGIAGFYLSGLVAAATDPAGVAAEPRLLALAALTAILALLGSFLVSYSRARAEGLGLECKVGWFERPERMVLLIVAAAFGKGPVLPAALWVLAVLSFLTAAQRVAHVWKSTRQR
jgi:CDP-diacylglycerol--glycerol-3-phosphate 3-phosphatidyltransferase